MTDELTQLAEEMGAEILAAHNHHLKHGDMDGKTCLLTRCAIHYPEFLSKLKSVAEPQSIPTEREWIADVALRSDADIEPGVFAGKFWTEDMFKLSGASSIIIQTAKGAILLDNNMPHTRYGDEVREKEWQKYIAERARQGWKWAASWGYGMFRRVPAPPKQEQQEKE